MATEEGVMKLLEEANPVPDVDALPLSPADGSSYLAAIDKRRTEMLETEIKDVRTKEASRPSWAGFSLAAAAILVLGTVGLLVLNRDRDSASNGIGVVETFIEAINSGTTELEAFVSDDATIGPMTIPLDDDLAAFWAGLDTEITLSGCEQSAQVVRCDYVWSDAIRRAQDRPEYGSFTFLIDGSRVARVARDWNTDASGWLEAGDPVIHYLQWLNANHPEWDDGLTWVGRPEEIGSGYAPLAHDDPVHNATYAAALTRYLDEYAGQLEGSDIEAIAP